MKFGGITITSGIPTVDNRTNWTGRQIRGSEKGNLLGSWIGFIVPGLFAAFVAWRAHGVFLAKNVPNPVVLIAGLASFFALLKTLWETVRLKRFGDPLLELSVAPVPLGSAVEGRVTLQDMTNAPEFSVTLACVHRTSGGNKNSTSEKVLWSAENKASLLLGGILPISISIPADQPQTNRANPFDSIFWRLTVKAPFPGPSFLEKYEIPVGQGP